MDPSGEIALALPISMGIRADITGRQLVGAGLAMGFCYNLLVANQARNLLTNALIHMTYEGETREFPWKDNSNIERLLHEHEQRASGDKPPDDPWGKILYYLGKTLELFHKD